MQWLVKNIAEYQMWQSKLIDTKNDENPEVIKIVILYFHEDGREETITERISDFSSESIKKIAKDGVDARNYKDSREQAKKKLLENPPLGEISFELPAPTEEEIRAKKIATAKRQKEDLDFTLNIGKITQEEYDTAIATIKNLL